MQSNLILKLSNIEDDEYSYPDTASIINAVNEVLESDKIDRVEVNWIEDKIDIIMKSGKVLKIKGNSRLDFKFNSLEF